MVGVVNLLELLIAGLPLTYNLEVVIEVFSGILVRICLCEGEHQ